MVRLSLQLGRTRTELLETLTAEDLGFYQAVVEIDGPWWGEREAAHMEQLCSIQAAAAGADVEPDAFKIGWTVGAPGEHDQGGANLLPSNDGIELFAARFGLVDLVREGAEV